MSEAPDVVVVGAGLSGLMVALLTAQQGATVTLLARGAGNTHTGSGCIGVLGYTSRGTLVNSPSRVLTRSLKDFPEHPYLLAGRNALEMGIETLREACRAFGHELVGDLRANYLLPTPPGALLPVCTVPSGMAAGHQAEDDEQPWLLVGIQGWREYDATYAAANLGQHVAAANIVLPAEQLGPDMSAFEIAPLFDDVSFRATVVAQLTGRIGEATRIGFPALLGLRDSYEPIADLAQRLERPVFEVMTVPPSLPGLRLYQALRDALQKLKVEIVLGPVARGWMERGKLQGVCVQSAGRERKLKAGHVVLATGGILGGGLEAGPDGTVRETVFDVPVTHPPPDQWFKDLFMDSHPIFEAGVRVNSWMQPLDATGEVISTRLHAVGGLLAAPDRIGMHSAQGIDLATAAKAAEVITR